MSFTTRKTALSLAMTGLLGSAMPPAQAATGTVTTPAQHSAEEGEQLLVLSPPVPVQAGSKTTLSAGQIQQNGSNNFGTLMRYQPLVSATGSSSGSTAGKSGFDRAGYTGYNIRGLESNRVGIEVDGIEMPQATGRSYAGRAGLGTSGIGRDYLDPYMYQQVEIESGPTSVEVANNAIGGRVSFLPKSAAGYLRPGKTTYFGYQSDYDSADRGWHNGLTLAGGDSILQGMLVISRRDGQETSNNSGELSSYPENWHSTALLASGSWLATDEHRLTATLDYYHKTTHSQYDSWNDAGSAIVGTAHQSGNTRRLGITLKDTWVPLENAWVDRVDTQIYRQITEAHDNTLIPGSSGTVTRVLSDYNVTRYGLETTLAKAIGRHDLRWGLNAGQSKTERPFSQDPVQSGAAAIMQPEADSHTETLGAFLQDNITFDLNGHTLAVVPGVRAAYQKTRAQNLSSLSANSSVLSEGEVATLYGSSNSDSQLLPSLGLIYNLTPALSTYIQYRRGAQFPNASQLYGSWNLGSSYAGRAQYALIGSPDLKTETSNNLEWGIKGEAAKGITFHTALFYNSYKNFIAETRYTRLANPAVFATVPGNIYTVYKEENRDKAYIYGAELTSRVEFGTWVDELRGLGANIGLGYSKGQAKSAYEGDKYVDLDSVPPMKAVLGLSWDAPDRAYGGAVTTTLVKGKRATATSRQTYSNSGTALADTTTTYMRIPGYALADLTAYWQVAAHVKLSGGIYNLTDRKYWDYLSSRTLTDTGLQDSYNQALAVQPGRTFQLAVNVDF
ncbi:TonB-dependent receptor [Chimaeribacter californicus]|uniref:TonB-dependent receptor n=1 Tax=Chimaeribacter californicus TaxID=2060067 RepID=A0A2N5E7B9_9GAMM|nr:TonB-dependent hemoglobin/transferrin/lactoferrin family receptor [Chimaeribacter californicus]PLR37372.1 TonB-dependent receptor [Chimaeribacter californicus]